MLIDTIQAELTRLQLHPINLSVSGRDDPLVTLQGSLLRYWNLPPCLDGEWLLAQLEGFHDAVGAEVVMKELVAAYGKAPTATAGEGRLRVPSPKTEHHEGHDCRWIPIFPELRPYLEAQWESTGPGSEFVVVRYRRKNANLRTQLERIILRAGLKPWPKLFQNLRSTRETELAETYPLHVVCAWIGNSQSVAQKHYLQVTDEHFAQGAGKVVQNLAQQAAASGSTEQKASETPKTNRQALQGLATICDAVRDWLAPRKEPSSKQYAPLKVANGQLPLAGRTY